MVMIMTVLLCWMMIMNVGRLTYERIAMQNAADNAAFSVAVFKARSLNKLAFLNHNLACTLYGGDGEGDDGLGAGLGMYYKYGAMVTAQGAPAGIPVPLMPMGGFPGGYNPPTAFAVDSQKKVACTLDIAVDGGKKFINIARAAVIGFAKAQDVLLAEYNPVTIQLLANKIARANGADAALVIQGYSSHDLKRNDKGIKYYETKKIKGLAAKILRAVIKALLSAAGIPGELKNIYRVQEWKEDKSSWLYIEDRNKFDKNLKITVVAGKVSSPDGFPVGKNIFKVLGVPIVWPPMLTIASAAVYNPDSNIEINSTDGPSFPIGENDKISPAIRSYKNAESEWRVHHVPVGEIKIPGFRGISGFEGVFIH